MEAQQALYRLIHSPRMMSALNISMASIRNLATVTHESNNPDLAITRLDHANLNEMLSNFYGLSAPSIGEGIPIESSQSRSNNYHDISDMEPEEETNKENSPPQDIPATNQHN